MNDVLVLTDFSAKALSAAKAALRIAQKCKTDLLLYHTFMLPDELEQDESPGFVLETYEKIRKQNIIKLKHLVSLLKDVTNTNGRYLPQISINTELGLLGHKTRNLIEKENIDLIVMGVRERFGAALFFKSSHINSVLNYCNKPVLLVPERGMKDILRIVLPIDLVNDNLPAIKLLCQYAQVLRAEIICLHIDLTGQNQAAEHELLNALLNDVNTQIDYDRIFFKGIDGKKLKHEIAEYIKNAHIDLIAIIHQQRQHLEKLFSTELTNLLLYHGHQPLLVLP